MYVVCTEPLPDPAKFARREGEAEKHAERRRNADQEAEYAAVTCAAVYMLLMSFSQRGIDKLRNYQEHLRMRYPKGGFVVSAGFDDGKRLSLVLIEYIADTSSSIYVVQRAVHQV